MNCPKCDSTMVAVTYRSLQIDRCPDCQGVWLDKSELESIIEKKLASLLDVGAYTAATP
jgi:Zn-finger nucleic acid-binding protein